jgi:hypothetical protein
MTRLPLLGLLAVSLSVGAYLGYRFLKRERNRPALIALHIVPGLIALEATLLLMRAGGSSKSDGRLDWAEAGMLLLVFAVLAGVLTPLIARGRVRGVALVSLAVHATLACSGIALVAGWALLSATTPP